MKYKWDQPQGGWYVRCIPMGILLPFYQWRYLKTFGKEICENIWDRISDYNSVPALRPEYHTNKHIACPRGPAHWCWATQECEKVFSLTAGVPPGGRGWLRSHEQWRRRTLIGQVRSPESTSSASTPPSFPALCPTTLAYIETGIWKNRWIMKYPSIFKYCFYGFAAMIAYTHVPCGT